MHNFIENKAKNTRQALCLTMLSVAVFGLSALAAADVELMALSRTSATAAAEAGNQFSADSGIFADESTLTIWSNNTQKTIGAIGGTARTPIVFNNAQTTGGWKPISVAGLNNADAFQIQFSTLGFDNIRFTCRQKSTGSGPDAFLLAYSIGNPQGPYVAIADSATGSNGIPAIRRVGNDTYGALQDSYAEFPLPPEMENEAEVYLRVVFNGLTTLGANGNTSINDIVIVGDEIDGEAVVNKTALNALIAEATQRVQSDYVEGSWATFAAALENALTAAANDEATQSEVNTARSALQAAMNALLRLDEVVELIAWPGADSVRAWDTSRTFLADSSGLDFHNGQLYAVDNKTGRLWILDVAADGALSFVPGFEGGKRVRFQKDANNPSANGPDAEGVTVDADGFVYVASERDNSNSNTNWNVILKVDPWAEGTELVALAEWDLTASLPQVSANAGIEAVEWVSNADVDGKLFDVNTGAAFDSANYPNATADGLFFVALEANGHVYAYVLNNDGSAVQIADIDSKLGGAMALDYDTYEKVLWVVADDGFGNRAAKITLTGSAAVGIVHVLPPGGLDSRKNFEGFAIAQAHYTRDGQRPVYRFEDGVSVGALTIGSIACSYTAEEPGGTEPGGESGGTEPGGEASETEKTSGCFSASGAPLDNRLCKVIRLASGCSATSGAPLGLLAIAFWALGRRRIDNQKP